MARKGGQMSLIALKEPALDLAEFDIAGMPYVAVRLFAYSGRNLYRPGRALRGLGDRARCRWPPGPAAADPGDSAPPRWQGAVDGHLAARHRHRRLLPAHDRTAGRCRHRFVEPRTACRPGAKLGGTSMQFAVEEFLPERMQLDLTTTSERLSDEAPWPFDVSGRYLYGAPAAGNQLLGVVTSERNRNPLAPEAAGLRLR
jgi:hypothetical protein